MAMTRLTIMMFLFCQIYSKSEQGCPKGHRVQTSSAGFEVCIQCEDGLNYQSDDNHTSRTCSDCSQVENPDLEIVETNCNITHNTHILCRPGYYRYKAVHPRGKDKCERCTECTNSVRKCSEYNDTVCCLSDETVVVSNDVIKCHNTLIVCGDGEYMKHGTTECVPCPEGLFMSDSNHNHALTNNFSHTPLHNWTCYPDVHNIVNHGEFRTYGVVLFSLAALIDILYIFLYSRTFLKKISIRIPLRNLSEGDKISRMCGTVCLDFHFALMFVHLFGVLCEVGVISMTEDVAWAFTIAVGVISIVIYFANAVVFIVVKRVLSLTPCCPRTRQNTRGAGQSSYGDWQAMINNTEV